MEQFYSNNNSYQFNNEYNQNLGNRYMCSTCECPCHMKKQPSCSRGEYNTNICYGLQEDVLEGMPIAMAYVPWQKFSQVYEADCALNAGTIFPELVKPFWVKCGQRM